jgi:hypothetical protein
MEVRAMEHRRREFERREKYELRKRELEEFDLEKREFEEKQRKLLNYDGDRRAGYQRSAQPGEQRYRLGNGRAVPKKPHYALRIPKVGYVCFKCHCAGHLVADCGKAGAQNFGIRLTPPQTYVCGGCRQRGEHWVEYCPRRLHGHA